MSHISKFELDVTNLDALDSACSKLGIELVRDQKTYKWYGTRVGNDPLPDGLTIADLGKCDHAIRVPGKSNAYEVGVVKNKTRPGYSLMWDYWMGGYGLEEKVGKNGDLLKQQYQVEHGIKFWQKKGYRVTTTTQGNEIQLRVKK